VAWVNETQNSVLAPGFQERWWWSFGQVAQAIVIQPLPHNAGGILHLSDHSVERKLDSSTVYYVTVSNEGPGSVEYNLVGVFLTQPT
jgi:hypothetical protein